MEARNRTLPKWFERISSRQIALPRFQRMEAWGPNEITALLTTVLRGLPAGATLTLEVGDQLPFISRTMVGAPENGERITELLLDGQQRLTALWRSLNNDYPDRVYLVSFEDDPHRKGGKLPVVSGQPRWRRNGTVYPLWVDSPKELWAHGFIPVWLLRPVDIGDEIDSWVDAATGDDYKLGKEVSRVISSLQDRIRKPTYRSSHCPLAPQRTWRWMFSSR